MSHKDYRDTGVRIMQSTDGSIMLVDDASKMTMQIPANDVENSLWQERGAFLVIRQIIHFVRKSSELRYAENEKTTARGSAEEG